MPVRGSILAKFLKDALQERRYPNTLYWYEENEIFYLSCVHAKNKGALDEQNDIYEAWDKIKPRKNHVEKSSKKQRFHQAIINSKYLLAVERLSTKNKKAYKFQDPNINSPERVQSDHPDAEEDYMMHNSEPVIGTDLPEQVQNDHLSVEKDRIILSFEPNIAENHLLQTSKEGHINNHDGTYVYAANGWSAENELFPQTNVTGQSDTCISVSEQYDGNQANTSHFQDPL